MYRPGSNSLFKTPITTVKIYLKKQLPFNMPRYLSSNSAAVVDLV